MHTQKGSNQELQQTHPAGRKDPVFITAATAHNLQNGKLRTIIQLRIIQTLGCIFDAPLLSWLQEGIYTTV